MIRQTAVVLTLLATIGLDSAIGAPKPVRLGLDVGGLEALQKRAEQYHSDLPKPASLGMDEIVAYEEHKKFVCVVGKAGGDKGPSLLRRVILVKPSLLLVDDRITGLGQDEKFRWRLSYSQVSQDVAYAAAYPSKISFSPHTLKGVESCTAPCKNGSGRVVIVIALGQKNKPVVKVAPSEKPLVLEIETDETRCKLTLPAGVESAGSIAIVGDKRKTLMRERVLPSGLMPHGPKGVKMLAGWDSRYTRDNSAPWDTKKVAVELKKAVESGTIKPGRALVLGCGAGTNSIYLASKGFDVTAMDVAPTALAMAKARADKAKVKVNWMLVDVTAVPKLKPFDFMFDRGCYHGVRRSNAKGFVESACKLSKPGTKFLILAGNANEARHYGPPRVKEEDIRKDFTSAFDFTWLRETQFGPDGEKGKGALMWSILLTRKSK